jgi:hypothetical protein
LRFRSSRRQLDRQLLLQRPCHSPALSCLWNLFRGSRRDSESRRDLHNSAGHVLRRPVGCILHTLAGHRSHLDRHEHLLHACSRRVLSGPGQVAAVHRVPQEEHKGPEAGDGVLVDPIECDLSPARRSTSVGYFDRTAQATPGALVEEHRMEREDPDGRVRPRTTVAHRAAGDNDRSAVVVDAVADVHDPTNFVNGAVLVKMSMGYETMCETWFSYTIMFTIWLLVIIQKLLHLLLEEIHVCFFEEINRGMRKM